MRFYISTVQFIVIAIVLIWAIIGFISLIVRLLLTLYVWLFSCCEFHSYCELLMSLLSILTVSSSSLLLFPFSRCVAFLLFDVQLRCYYCYVMFAIYVSLFNVNNGNINVNSLSNSIIHFHLIRYYRTTFSYSHLYLCNLRSPPSRQQSKDTQILIRVSHTIING